VNGFAPTDDDLVFIGKSFSVELIRLNFSALGVVVDDDDEDEDEDEDEEDGERSGVGFSPGFRIKRHFLEIFPFVIMPHHGFVMTQVILSPFLA